MSTWRRTVAGDLTSVFRTQTDKEPALDYVNRDRHIEMIVAARNKELPTNYKELTPTEIAAINANPRTAASTSHQEPGTRHACALPYELYAHGALSSDGKHVELELTAANKVFGHRAAGAPFNVYLRNLTKQPGMQAATYTVKAGDTLRPKIPLDLFKDGRFEVEILAPNGFYRRFTGTAQEPPAVILASLQQSTGDSTGSLELHLHNPSLSAQTLTITDNSYGAAAITKHLGSNATETVTIPLESSHQWYDLTVQAAEGKTLAHFAGRLETGRATQTDPLMGSA